LTDFEPFLVAWDISDLVYFIYFQVEGIAPCLKPLLGPETLVAPTQNGIEAPEKLAAALGKEHILGGYIRIQALVKGPGHIDHDGLVVAEFGTGALPGGWHLDINVFTTIAMNSPRYR
jgi:ketopantoate reductase